MNTAKIIALTNPILSAWETQTESPIGAEAFIAYTARVSNPSNQSNTLTAPKLLKYLIEHKHWSPFEMVSITMEINTTRDISHQIIRHRSFSFQEFSQRYADPTKDMQFVTREARLQDAKNRQNSIEVDDLQLQDGWEFRQDELTKLAKGYYKWAIDNDIAKEQARAILPEGLTTTRLYMSGTLRSWIHYIDVRAEEGTQKEHRQVALAARTEILKHFPSLSDYWFEDMTWNVGEPRGDTMVTSLDGLEQTDYGYNFKDKPKSWWWKFWS